MPRMPRSRDNLNRYQAQLEPVRRVVMIGLPILFGLFAGSAAASQWQKALLFFNQEPFGQTDPLFNLDISFYLMTLPFLGFVTGFLISIAVVAGIAGILTHYLYGSIRIMERGIFTSRAAQIHIAVTGALFLVLLGVNFWLDRYTDGAEQLAAAGPAPCTRTSMPLIPTKAILAVAAGLVAILFIIAAIIGRWRLPGHRHGDAGHYRHPGRRGLPVGHPAVPGASVRKHLGEGLHRAKHQA